MVTKNTIHKFFSDFAENHTQIKSFGYGDLWEISASEGQKYPLLWACPQPSTISGNEIFYTYKILVADRVLDGRTNAVEVESDTMQICLDLLAALDDQSGEDWAVSDSATIEPFREEEKDRIDGHSFDTSLVVPFDYDQCQIPTIN